MIEGVVGVLWFFIWWIYSAESPSTHSGISREECLYIERAIGENTTAPPNKVLFYTLL